MGDSRECELARKAPTNQRYAAVDCTRRELEFSIAERMRAGAPCCSGVLKEKYSDFLVNEIDLAGNVLHLCDLSCPAEPEAREVAGGEREHADLRLLGEHFTPEQIDRVRRVLDTGEGCVESERSLDKPTRSAIHKIVREAFSARLVSETTEGRVKIYHKTNRTEGGDARNLSSSRSQVTKFLLLKENRDTIECIGFIAAQLRTSAKNFAFAGTKDKRAVTVQAVTARGIPPKRLAGLNRVLKNARLGGFSSASSMLGLGDLSGNEFTVVLRNFQLHDACSDAELKESIDSLAANGFVNYFGLQRFGTGAVSTSTVGEAIVLQRWKEAVELIMASHQSDSAEYGRLQRDWLEDKSKREFLSRIPSRLVAERAIANYFLSDQGNPNDYLGALERVPRELRMLYLHSFQSLIWNAAASCRIKLGRSGPIAGDLVRLADGQVKVVESKDLGLHTIGDVVLPIPGHSVVYPEARELQQVYQDTRELFEATKQSKIASLPGTYRRLVEVPRRLVWSLEPYSKDDVEIVPSDLDAAGCRSGRPPSDEPRQLTAMVLSFQLPASAYATMCVRECVTLLA